MNVFRTANGVSLVQVMDKYSDIKVVKHHVNGLSCPFCGHNGCFGVYGKTKGTLDRWKCFSCGKQGNGIDYVKNVKGYSDDAEAAKDICNSFGLSYEDNVPQLDPAKKDYYDVMQFTAEAFHWFYKSKLNPNPNYFESRGLSSALVDSYVLGYCPSAFTDKFGHLLTLKDILQRKFPSIDCDSFGLYNSRGDSLFSERYIFPIRNSGGHIVGFAGRSLNSAEAKYKNTANNDFFNKSFALFNIDKAKAYSSVYVVEGYMDALSLIEAGVSNVVAAMGTAFGDSHLSVIKGKDIILSLDSDAPGQDHIASIIESHRDIRFSVLNNDSKYKDFNDALTQDSDFHSYFSGLKVKDGADFLIGYLKKNYDLGILSNRSAAWVRLAKLLGNSARSGYPINEAYTPIEYDFYWKHLNRLLKGGK